MLSRILAAVTIICLAGSTFGDERGPATTSITLEPELGYGFGNSQYQITYSGYDSASTTYYAIRSKLIFPVDGLSGGAKVRFTRTLDARHRLGAAVGVSFPITDPGSRMSDGDWVQIIPGPETQVGYTQSRPQISGSLISAEGSYGFVNANGPSYDIVFGFRYQRVTQDIDNYSGWYAGVGYVQGNEPALHYRVTYTSPSIGLRVVTGGRPGRAQFRIEGAFAPTKMSDYDNHLLRKKDSRAEAWGMGGQGTAGIRFNLGRQRRGVAYLDLSARIFYTKATMTQTQSWYGDDPATPTIDDTGTVLSGIPYSIKTLQFGFNARLGFAL
ncbi:MAG: hypothetical protein HY851_11825 [candidate division Zixibacteria bacterium]|nr:hypothetical protein [candidate division Zixibacteria bacterium]